MTGVVAVWANLPDELLKWYEEEYVPHMRERNSIWTIHCELGKSGFEGEPIGKLDAPWKWFTLYEVPDIEVATAALYDRDNHPPEEMLLGSLSQVRFDVAAYRQIECYEQDDWDPANIVSTTVLEWHIRGENKEEVLEWHQSFVGPLLLSSPETLRFRVFEVHDATTLQGTSYETKDKNQMYSFLSMIELESDQWPWEHIFEMAEDNLWQKYFGNPEDSNWQISSYLVKRLYQDEAKEKANASSNDNMLSTEGTSPPS